MRRARRWNCSTTCSTTSRAPSSGGPRVAAVRASFRLAELLPVDESIEQERENLSAPVVKLMHTVAAAIREDLSKVKDVLDIFVRRGGGQPKSLAPQVGCCTRSATRSACWAWASCAARVQESHRAARGMIVSRQRSSREKSRWCRSPPTLISVEDHLDDQLVG